MQTVLRSRQRSELVIVPNDNDVAYCRTWQFHQRGTPDERILGGGQAHSKIATGLHGGGLHTSEVVAV